MFTPETLSGTVVREIRDRHKMSRNKFMELAGLPGRSAARLSNIERNNSWKSGDREKVAALLNQLEPNFDPRYHASLVTTPVTAPASNGDAPAIYLTFADEDPDELLVDVVSAPIERALATTDDDDEDLSDPVIHDSVVNVYGNVMFEKQSSEQRSETEPVRAVMTSTDDDRYGVSNSELQTWKRCRRKWWFSYYRRLALQTEVFVGARAVGDRIHRALAHWYVPDGTPRVDPRDALERVVVEDWTRIATAARERNIDDEQLSVLAAEFAQSTNLERAMIEGYVQWLEETGADADLRITASETALEAPVTVIVDRVEREAKFIGKLDVRARRTTDDVRLFLDHKPQPLSAPIMTPTGWSKMGELRVGNVICGAHGEPVSVTHVFDRGVDDVYEVTLNDGTSVHATADHPWIAKDTVYGSWKIVATSDLKTNRHRLQSFTPYTDDVDVQLPIEPYTLGAWIANGKYDGHSICDGVRETLDATGLPVYVALRRENNTSPLYEVYLPIEARRALDELNLRGLRSPERFIPETYIRDASYGQRLALLHGLMDGDGCLTTYSHSSIYVTTSQRLAYDVASLVRSLGAWAKIWRSPNANRVGTRATGYDTTQHAYSVSIRSEFNPFLHVHHVDRWYAHREATRGHRGTTSIDRIVKKVEYVGREEVRCIEIDSSEKLYVTADYIVSHNTVGDLKGPAVTLPQNEQMLHYMLLEWLNTPEGESRCDGALYNMLRRTKRTARAQPPFYDRVEVHHNPYELASYRQRALAATADVLRAIDRLNDGESHLTVTYPSPRSDCKWDCDFFAVCNLFDDGSAGVEDMVKMLYHEVDPRARYQEERGRET